MLSCLYQTNNLCRVQNYFTPKGLIKVYLLIQFVNYLTSFLLIVRINLLIE